jgi:hypothetical protein
VGESPWGFESPLRHAIFWLLLAAAASVASRVCANVLREPRRTEVISQRRVRLGEIVRQHVAGFGDHIRWAALLPPGEVEERATEMPARSRALPPDECVTVCSKPRIELSLGNAQPAASDGRIAREGPTECGSDGRARPVVEGVTLGGEKTQRAPGVSQLPPSVIEIAARAIRREPLHVVTRRLGEQHRHVRGRTRTKRALGPPFLQHAS